MVPLSWFIDAICLLSAKTAISLGYSPLIGKHIFSFKRPVSASLSYRQTDSSPAFDTNMNLSSAVNESAVAAVSSDDLLLPVVGTV